MSLSFTAGLPPPFLFSLPLNSRELKGGVGPHLVCVGTHGDPEGAGESEVCKLELVVLPVDEEVLGLQIAMQDPAWGAYMHERERRGEIAVQRRSKETCAQF
jgi:hypothetical protein